MTHTRLSVLVLGACTGILLLFFAVVVAEVTETSERSATRKAAFTGTTILTRVHENQSSAGDDDVDSTKRRTHDDSESGSSRDDDATGSDESASIRHGDKDDESVTSMRSDATKSSSDDSDDGSSDGGKRHDEISEENHSGGKSSSAKAAVSDDSLGLSRTNELTAAIAKPASNDSRHDNEKKNLGNGTLEEPSNREGTSSAGETGGAAVKRGNEQQQQPSVAEKASAESTERTTEEESLAKREERKNVTVLNKEEAAVTSVGRSPTSGDAVVKPEKKEKLIKSDYEESISRKDDEAAGSKGNAEENGKSERNRDRESTTVRGVSLREGSSEEEDSKEDEANDLATTASEAVDLKKTDEKDHDGRTVSLINDTYVNHFHKTLTEKDRGSSVNRTGDGNAVSKGNPKAEVEVVKNVVTHQPILKIVATANDTAKTDSRLNAVNGEAVHGTSDAVTDENQRADATIDSEADARRKSLGQPESQVKLAETTTTPSVRRDDEHTSSSVSDRATASPVPQGRTIGLSVVNEFPSIEMKPTSSTKNPSSSEAPSSSASHVSVTPSSKPNGSKAERIDRKPYPYVKSSREPLQATTVDSGLKLESGEETSAYENTIGKGEPEKKIVIVTEPSVVIENSIQQQKPDEREAVDEPNESRNSTTASPSASVTTSGRTIVSADAGSTNATLPEGLNVNAEMNAASGSSAGNDVPGVKEEEKVTARRDDEGYDVTGNGITEVSSLAPDGGKPVKSRSGTATESSRTTPTNTDIQMEPEEALMIRSTLDVTESTIVPPSKGGTSEAKFTAATWMTPTAEINATDVATMVLENSTEPTPKANVTTERPSSTTADQSNAELASGITLNPDESSIPTTTSVEFEFVELTEAVSSASNATERTVDVQSFDEQTTKATIATSVESSAMNNSTEETTITTARADESTELAATTEDGTPTTNQVSVTYHGDNETIEVRNLSTVTSRSSPAEDRNNRTESTSNEITVNPIDFTSVGVTSAGITDDPSGSKDPNYDGNVTGTSPPPPPGVVVTTNATKSPPASFSTSGTLEPRVIWSTPTFAESLDEETTDGIQPFSSDDITYVKIIIEGTLHDVCPRLQDLRKALANVLTNGVDKRVLPKQIIIHQNPCLESINSSPPPTEVPLTPILVYVVDEYGKFDVVMTKILPSLYKMSSNFPVRVHKFLLVPEPDSGNAIAVVVVSSVAFICLVLLAGLLFIMRKRQTRFNYGERCRPVSLDAYSLDSVSAYNSVRRKGAARASKRSYGNPTFEDSSAIPSHPLNFAGLSSFCTDVNAINEEFSGIPQVSAKIDELPPGAELKNRYANVIPLPETRVPLQKLNNDTLTEYINASYVRGPKNATKYYIACQAPLESTVTDFWRMIWEQQCKVIIMLTDLVENGVEKCTEYIPPSEVTDCHRLYGDYQVTLKKRETKEKYAISTLHLKNLENNTFREVFHIWYLWPVSGVQSDGTGLIAVLLEARALQRGGPGPIVVHCSPGTGRTGTLIALDLGIRQYEITRTVDVPRVVYTIRRDRAGAVQTKEQYAFIYKALNLYATKLAGGVLEST